MFVASRNIFILTVLQVLLVYEDKLFTSSVFHPVHGVQDCPQLPQGVG